MIDMVLSIAGDCGLWPAISFPFHSTPCSGSSLSCSLGFCAVGQRPARDLCELIDSNLAIIITIAVNLHARARPFLKLVGDICAAKDNQACKRCEATPENVFDPLDSDRIGHAEKLTGQCLGLA